MVGVQYQNSVTARSDAHFTSSKSGGHNRAPDLVLRPTKEGMDFTIRLIQANRMSKVVEIQFDNNDYDDDDDVDEKKTANTTTTNKYEEVTDEDVKNLFQAIGGKTGGEEDEEEDDSGEDVTDDYQPTNNQVYTGLPHLESLVILVSGDDLIQDGDASTTFTTTTTPSFITSLTSFLSASAKFPRFTRLALQGVNLRGDILELRGLAEAFRLHPHINHVQLISCHFTPQQQANMNLLEDVFNGNSNSNSSRQYPGESTNSIASQTTSILDAQRANIRKMKQLILQYQQPANIAATTEATEKKKKQSTTGANKAADDDSNNKDEGNWLERFLKTCFCWPGL